MRIIFIGTVKSSAVFLQKLINLNADIRGVVTKKEASYNADFVDLTPICRENNIPFIFTNNVNDNDTISWIQAKKPDIIFCFGFSALLKKPLLELAPMGVVGFHPAALPKNRGRHPIIWALALGLTETASTFFFMDEGADSGDILSQKPIAIDYSDDASTLYKKILKAGQQQIEEFLPLLENGTFPRIEQDDSKANYWRKRSKEDGRIDFRMCKSTIYNLVRALTKPYVGAHIIYQGKEIKIWKAQEIEFDGSNIEPGKILKIKGNTVTVKCADGAVALLEHEFETLPCEGEYI